MSHKPVTVIYGGTFDPFHCGHEAICESILSNSLVAELIIVPCFVPALKASATASAFDRLDMLKLWRTNHINKQRITISDIEVERGGPSYTVDTVNAIASMSPKSNVIFALGADAWNSLPKWHQFDQLVKRVGFWVFKRAGEPTPKIHDFCQQQFDLKSSIIISPNQFYVDDSVNTPISSSEIRHGGTVANNLPAAIDNYIKQHRLYNRQAVN